MQQANQTDQDYVNKAEQVGRLFSIFPGAKNTSDTTINEYITGLVDVPFSVVLCVVDKYKFGDIEEHKTRFPPEFPEFYGQIKRQIMLDRAVKNQEGRNTSISMSSRNPLAEGNTPIETSIEKARVQNLDRQVIDKNVSVDEFKARCKSMQFPVGTIWRLGVVYGPSNTAVNGVAPIRSPKVEALRQMMRPRSERVLEDNPEIQAQARLDRRAAELNKEDAA
tara:strand:+ start:7199 stop:7864 length:666 start_codon:yes stop_codon:yes gene_type:complete